MRFKETDGGSYMCAIYNGSRRFLRRTTIVVNTPPVFTRVPQGAEVDAGAQLFLHCQVRILMWSIGSENATVVVFLE